jgi:hypothetical protein
MTFEAFRGLRRDSSLTERQLVTAYTVEVLAPAYVEANSHEPQLAAIAQLLIDKYEQPQEEAA